MMAMASPHMVAISASPIPPVICPVAPSTVALPSDRNVRKMPETVPSNPSNGASVTSVSITVRKRPAFCSSTPAALAPPPKDALADDGDRDDCRYQDGPHDRPARQEVFNQDIC